MANVQMPVLFTISDSTGATLFGENITADLIENHLPFTLDRSGAFHTTGFDAATVQSTLLDAFMKTESGSCNTSLLLNFTFSKCEIIS